MKTMNTFKDLKLAGGFKLVELNGMARIALAEGVSTTVADGIHIAMSGASGEALVEIAPGLAGKVFIDGRAVIDVSGISPGSRLVFGETSYVLLAPLAALIGAEKSREETFGLIAAHAGEQIANDALRAATIIAPEPIKLTPRSRRRLVLMSLTALMLFGLAYQFQSQGRVQKPGRDEAIAMPVVAQPAAAIAIASPQPSEAPPALEAAASPQPDPTPLPVRSTVPRAVEAKPKKVAAAEGNAGTGVSAEQLAQFTEQYREMVLEARFNPEGIKRRASELIKQVPKGTKLNRDLAGLISRL